MQDKANTAVHSAREISETQLGDISGGPHWQTWDPPTYLTDQKDEDTRAASGHYTQVVWANTRG